MANALPRATLSSWRTKPKCASTRRARLMPSFSTCHDQEKTMNTLANRPMNQPFPSAVSANVADAAALIGRILLAVIFIKSGWSKIGGFDQTAAMMASKGLPMAQVLLVITIAIEFGAGILLVIG